MIGEELKDGGGEREKKNVEGGERKEGNEKKLEKK